MQHLKIYFFFISGLLLLSTCKKQSVVTEKDAMLGGYMLLNAPVDQHINKILRQPDGSCYLIGKTGSNGTGDYDGLLIKIDVNNKVLWYKIFGGAGNDEFNSGAFMKDNSLVLVGKTNSFYEDSRAAIGLKSDGYLVKTDLNGNLIWEHPFAARLTDTSGKHGLGDDVFNDVVVNSANQIFANGYTGNAGSNIFPYLLCVNSNGQRVWESPTNNFHVLFTEYGCDVSLDKDENIVSSYMDNNYVWGWGLRTYSPDQGQLIKNAFYKFNLNSSNWSITDIYGDIRMLILNDTTYILRLINGGLASSTGPVNEPPYTFIKVANNTILSINPITHLGEIWINSMKIIDNEIYLSGYTYTNGAYDALLVKGTKDGKVFWNFGFAKGGKGLDVFKEPDGRLRFFVRNSSSSENSNNILIMYLDSNGNLIK